MLAGSHAQERQSILICLGLSRSEGWGRIILSARPKRHHEPLLVSQEGLAAASSYGLHLSAAKLAYICDVLRKDFRVAVMPNQDNSWRESMTASPSFAGMAFHPAAHSS